MTTYDREEVACHLCFRDKVLQDWIKEEGERRGTCPWCGKNGYLIQLEKLGEPFREVASLYAPVESPDAYKRGEHISFLLDEDWGVFSEKIQCDGLAQKLAVTILYADLRPKEYYDYPDYDGFFRSEDESLEDDWDAKAYAALKGEMPNPDREEAERIESEIAAGLPSQIQIAFEDLATTIDQEKVLYRARKHEDRRRTSRFAEDELSAPPPHSATAGRANRKGEPVLYLASNKSTALAEVRAWKGLAVAIAEVIVKRRLLLVDLSQVRRLKSPFFVELLRWRVQLAGLLYRLGSDMSRPVMPHEQELFYRPTQFLAWLIRSSGYDGFIYPSAMGSEAPT